MGESTNPRSTLRFDRRIRLEFHGATITSDAGLLACRDECLQESRGGRNVQHRLVGLLRQSVYSRLAGYEDTNDAERLADDPTMRVVVGDRGIDRPAASTNTMSRFAVISTAASRCKTAWRSRYSLGDLRPGDRRLNVRLCSMWRATPFGSSPLPDHKGRVRAL